MIVSPLRLFLHRAFFAFVLATALVFGSLVAVNAYAASKVAKVPTVRIDSSVLQPGGNYLLVGSDSRSFVDSSSDQEHFGSAQSQSGQRSDTIMLAHVDGGSGTGFLVSFPRDLWVSIPGAGSAKINAAFNAGPQRLIETIENDFNVPVSHYLQVDFAGFRNIVDALGSIPIFFPTPARDAKSGLYVYQSGCKHLGGTDALAYVRSRYYESEIDGEWKFDPTSDLGRIQRQQYFLRTLAQQAVKVGEHSPWRAPKILDAMLANLQRDSKLGYGSLRALANAFHGAGTLETTTLPTHPRTIDGQSALVLDDAAAAPILARLRGEGSSSTETTNASTVSPKDVSVAVRNGSGRNGLAATVLRQLDDAGFHTVGSAANAGGSNLSVTEVRYAPDSKDKGAAVLARLGGAGKLVAAGTRPDGADVELVLGRDFTTVSAATPTTAAKPSAGSGASSATTNTAGGSLPAAGC